MFIGPALGTCELLFKGASWLVQYPLSTGVLSWDSYEGEPRGKFRLQAGQRTHSQTFYWVELLNAVLHSNLT